MSYTRKTIDRWDIMSDYGYGWECESSEYTLKEAKQTLKEYRENGGGAYRLEKHREKKGGNKMGKIDKFEIMATYEGKSWDCCDIEIWNGDKNIIISNVPFFDKDGREISYDDALELYGEDGLAQDIWDDPDYVKYVKAYAEKQIIG